MSKLDRKRMTIRQGSETCVYEVPIVDPTKDQIDFALGLSYLVPVFVSVEGEYPETEMFVREVRLSGSHDGPLLMDIHMHRPELLQRRFG